MIILGNAKVAAAGLALTAIIFAVLYFTVIKPSSDTANDAVKQGLKQTSQELQRSNKAVDNATKAAGGGATAAGSASKSADKAISKAQKLATCLSAAGTDTTKLQACQARYGR